MADNAYDFAVLGSGAQAVLLAAHLARDHRKSVVLIAQRGSRLRVRRGFDLAMAPITRPETMIVLQRGAAEVLAMIEPAAKGIVGRVDQHFVAESAATRDGLMHFRQLARLMGISTDLATDRTLPAAGVLRVRNVPMLDTPRLLAGLKALLAGAGVRRLDPAATAVSLKRDGSVRLTHLGIVAEARQAVVAGDDAIAAYVSADALDKSLLTAPATATLLPPLKVAHADPFVSYLDRGVSLLLDSGAGLHAVVKGTAGDADQRLASALRLDRPAQRAGSASFTTYTTVDGAPFLGPVKGGRAVLVAGFGNSGAFFSPAIARMLVGAAPEDEANWFAARGQGRVANRATAAEFSGAAA